MEFPVRMVQTGKEFLLLFKGKSELLFSLFFACSFSQCDGQFWCFLFPQRGLSNSSFNLRDWRVSRSRQRATACRIDHGPDFGNRIDGEFRDPRMFADHILVFGNVDAVDLVIRDIGMYPGVGLPQFFNHIA
jgi:hypothetical protein